MDIHNWIMDIQIRGYIRFRLSIPNRYLGAAYEPRGCEIKWINSQD